MILIRPTVEEDTKILRDMHELQGLDYDYPDSFLVGESVEIDGSLNRAALCRKTVEMYYLIDPRKRLSRREEIGLFIAMRREIEAPLRRVGVTDLHCWLPPEMEQRFGKLLMHLGWTKPQWQCYHLDLNEERS